MVNNKKIVLDKSGWLKTNSLVDKVQEATKFQMQQFGTLANPSNLWSLRNLRLLINVLIFLE